MGLIRLTSCSLPALEDDGATWIQVAKTGIFKGYPGGLSLTADVIGRMVENFDHPIPMKYGHGSDAESAVSGAAGWIHELRFDEAEGALLARCNFTPRARDMIRAGEHRHVSIEFSEHDIDRVTGEDRGPALYAVALTLEPFILGMTPLAASRKAASMENNEGIAAISAALEAEGAEVEDVSAWLAQNAEAIVKAILAGAGDDEITALSAQLQAVRVKLAESEARAEAAEADLERKELEAIEALVDGAIEAGLISVDKRDQLVALGLSDRASLDLLLEALSAREPAPDVETLSYRRPKVSELGTVSEQDLFKIKAFMALGFDEATAQKKFLAMKGGN